MLKGIMVNKDVTHNRMRRMIKDPRIILLDCSLEYKKGESQVPTRVWDFLMKMWGTEFLNTVNPSPFTVSLLRQIFLCILFHSALCSVS